MDHDDTRDLGLNHSMIHGPSRPRSLVFMFSGQGSQYPGMGRELFDHQATFRRWMLRCNEIVQPLIGGSVLAVLYPGSGRAGALVSGTVYAHCALFMIQWSLAQTLLERGLRPDLLLGYSSGELVAATVAGTFSLEDALLMIVDQARLLDRWCPAGCMAAVLESLTVRDRFATLFDACEVAAINYTRHFVVAGRPPAVQRLRAGLNRAGVICEILPIPFGFHSSLVDPVEAEVTARAARIVIRPALARIVSSAYGGAAPAAGPDFFWHVLRQTVRFDRALAVLEESGPHLYVDVGPSGTLASFVKHGLGAGSRSVARSSLSPFLDGRRALDRLERAVGSGSTISGAGS